MRILCFTPDCFSMSRRRPLYTYADISKARVHNLKRSAYIDLNLSEPIHYFVIVEQNNEYKNNKNLFFPVSKFSAVFCDFLSQFSADFRKLAFKRKLLNQRSFAIPFVKIG